MKINILFIFILIFNISRSQIPISDESIQSLYIEVYHNANSLGNATGFIIQSKTRYYLVTNFHVLSGGESIDGENKPDSSHTPNRIDIHYFSKSTILGKYVIKSEPLYKNKQSLWRGNVTYANDKWNKVDVVELPLNDTIGVYIKPIDYHTSINDFDTLYPSDQLFVVGFPFSLQLTSKGLPIWESGTIASEPDANDLNMWFNAAAFPGMSGSPVYYIAKNEYNSYKKAYLRGSFFIGVFSGYESWNIKNEKGQIIQSYGLYGVIWKADYLRMLWDKLP